MRGFERTDSLQGATLSQRARIFLAETLGLGPFYTRVAVWGELDDERTGSLSEAVITPIELARLKDRITGTSSEEARYDLLSQSIPGDEDKDGKDQRVWFDVIPGLTEHPIIRGVAHTAQNILPAPKSRWEHIGDLGAGTGALGSSLQSMSDRITLVDRVPSLLGVAARRYGSAMEYVEG